MAYKVQGKMVNTSSCESNIPNKHMEALRLGKDVGSLLLDYGWVSLALGWVESTNPILPVVIDACGCQSYSIFGFCDHCWSTDVATLF